jgi:hypothetical protein
MWALGTDLRSGDMESKDHNTLISLREYVDIRFDAQEKAVNAALAAADRAVNKAEIASEKRFENMNEFRGALADSARLLMPRAEYEQAMRGITNKVELLESRVNARDDRSAGEGQGWTKIGLAISVVANLALVFYYLSKVQH